MSLATYTELPANLPVPVDDGACAQLPGRVVPRLSLPVTGGGTVDLGALDGWVVVYVYPMTGRPGVALPPGWDAIPGARGCTPESCGFRDNHAGFSACGVRVFGLSSQDTVYQQEVHDRLHLPFELLSDERLEWARALSLPTFEVEGRRLLRRVTLVLVGGVVRHVFYPIFPPDTHAAAVLAWVRAARSI